METASRLESRAPRVHARRISPIAGRTMVRSLRDDASHREEQTQEIISATKYAEEYTFSTQRLTTSNGEIL